MAAVTQDPRTAGGRHASLAAAADWSYRLLDEEQQRVFRVLSVFPGLFTLEAAEAVAGPSAGTAVLRLVDCSLVAPPRRGPDGRARYALLETLRAFGAERLTEAGEQDAVQAALAQHAVDVAEAAAVGLLTTAGEPTAVSWLDAESATLNHAVSWALGHDGRLALRLATSLAYWWHVRSRQAEGYRLLDDAAQHAETGSDQWCAAQFWLGWLAADNGMSMTAFLSHMTAVIDALTQRIVGGPLLARALAFRAIGVANQDRLSEGTEDAQHALDLAVELGDPFAEAFALYALAYVAAQTRDVQTIAWYRRTLDVDLAAVPGWLTRYCLSFLGGALGYVGEIAEARHQCDRALALSRSVGTLSGEGMCLVIRAGIEVKSGDIDAARSCLASAVALHSRSGAALLLHNILRGCVELTGRLERWRECVTLRAAWAAFNASTLQMTMPVDDLATPARAALGAADIEAAEQRGAAMTAEAAAAYALEAIADEPVGRDYGAQAYGPPLSARERELVLLVAQGRTDAQIAAQLFISIRTVRSHLDRIRDKTGCRRRADLTRLALQAGLI